MEYILEYYSFATGLGIILAIAFGLKFAMERALFLSTHHNPIPVFDPNNNVVDVMCLLEQGGHDLFPKLVFNADACLEFQRAAKDWSEVIFDLSNLPTYGITEHAVSALMLISVNLKTADRNKKISFILKHDYNSTPEQIGFRDNVHQKLCSKMH